MRRRVVITGMGCVTPLGHSVEQLYDNQIAGKSGVAPIKGFNARRFKTTFAAEVKDFDLKSFVPDCERWSWSGVNSRFSAAASQQALADAGILGMKNVDPARSGVYLGCGEGIQDFEGLVTLISQNYLADKRTVDAAGFTAGRLQQLDARLTRSRARDAHDARSPRRAFRPGRAQLQLPHCLRRQQPGRRRSCGDDPPARGRSDAFWRQP